MLPERMSVPLPFFVRLALVPVTIPLTVRLPALILRVLEEGMFTKEPFRVRSLDPAKVKFPFHIWEFTLTVLELPLVLSMVPPFIWNVLEPIALLLFKASVPALSTVYPE